jgi:hypothetical protein
MSNSDTGKQHQLELYKLEYEKAAIRYEDIYKAVWQNFSYMAVLAGAILTFGEKALGPGAAALVACIPLLFWYWATYEPLNRYGDRVERRLSEIEQVVNAEFFTVAGAAGEAPRRGLYHYADFRETHLGVRRDGEPYSPAIRWSRRAFAWSLCAFAVAAALVFGLVFLEAGSNPLISSKGFLILLLLLVLWGLLYLLLSQQSRVRAGIRLFAGLIHLAFLFLLGTWLLPPSSHVDPAMTPVHLDRPSVAVEASGSSSAVHRVLLAALGAESRQYPSDGSETALEQCLDQLRAGPLTVEDAITKCGSLIPSPTPPRVSPGQTPGSHTR